MNSCLYSHHRLVWNIRRRGIHFFAEGKRMFACSPLDIGVYTLKQARAERPHTKRVPCRRAQSQGRSPQGNLELEPTPFKVLWAMSHWKSKNRKTAS